MQSQHEPEVEALNDIIQSWIDYSVAHPQVMLGTHLRASAVISALAMRMCGMGAEKIEEALGHMRDVTIAAYHQASKEIPIATIQ